jgi:hypothetical protein
LAYRYFSEHWITCRFVGNSRQARASARLGERFFMRGAGCAGAGAGAATAGTGVADGGAGRVWAWTPAVKSTMNAATIVAAAGIRFIIVAPYDVNSRLKVLPAARKLNAR